MKTSTNLSLVIQFFSNRYLNDSMKIQTVELFCCSQSARNCLHTSPQLVGDMDAVANHYHLAQQPAATGASSSLLLTNQNIQTTQQRQKRTS
jgi:hypothetical protein